MHRILDRLRDQGPDQPSAGGDFGATGVVEDFDRDRSVASPFEWKDGGGWPADVQDSALHAVRTAARKGLLSPEQ